MSSQPESSSRSSTSGVETRGNSSGSLSSSPQEKRRRGTTWRKVAEDGSIIPDGRRRRTPPYLDQSSEPTNRGRTRPNRGITRPNKDRTGPNKAKTVGQEDSDEDDEGIDDDSESEPEAGRHGDADAMDDVLDGGDGDSPLSPHSSLVLRSEESSASPVSGEEQTQGVSIDDKRLVQASLSMFVGDRAKGERGPTRPVAVIDVSSDSSDDDGDDDFLMVSAPGASTSTRRVTAVKRPLPTTPGITYGQLKRARRRQKYGDGDDSSSSDVEELKRPVAKKRSDPNAFANFVVPKSRLFSEPERATGVVVIVDSAPAPSSSSSTSLLSANHPQSVKSLPASAIAFGASSKMEAYGSCPMSIEQRAALAQGLPLEAILPMLNNNEPFSPHGTASVTVSPRLRKPPSPPDLNDDAANEDDGEELDRPAHPTPSSSRGQATQRAPHLPERSLAPASLGQDGFNWRRWGVTPVWPASTIYTEIERRQSKWPAAYQELNRAIWQHLGANLQNADTYLWKMGVRQQIESVIKKELPNSHLIAVGSTINGCGSYNSDMDLCCCVYDHRGELHEKRAFAQRNLRRVQRQLYRLPIVESVEYINAKVPILRVDLHRPYDTLQIDINVNNTPGIYNSYLLHYYSRLDDRFPALCLVLKHWAKSIGIGDASEGSFNSYSLNLMALHFLQVGASPPVLPNLLKLYPGYFSIDQPLAGMKLFNDLPKPPPAAPKNDRSVAELLVAMFDYYANFDYDFHAISIARGEVIPRHTLPRATDHYPIFIEEPYERKNTARCVRNAHMWGRILAALNEARDALHRSKRPPSLDALNIRPENYGVWT